MMIFSCGHDNKHNLEFSGHTISVTGYDRVNERCVIHMTVCDHCLSVYQLTDEILHTAQDIERWLRGDQ